MPIRVLASVIERDHRLLVCRRPLHKRHGGLWEFPGGKVREGESDLEAARRERSPLAPSDRRYLGPVVAQCRKGLPTQDKLGAGEERDLPVILS